MSDNTKTEPCDSCGRPTPAGEKCVYCATVTDLDLKSLQSDYLKAEADSDANMPSHVCVIVQKTGQKIPLKTNKVDKESVLSRVTHEGYHMTGLENRLFQLIEHITKVLRQFRILSSDHPELQDEKLVQEMTLLVRFMKNERNDLISSWGY